MKNIEQIINGLKSQDFFEDQIIHIEKIEKKAPELGKLTHKISPKIHRYLRNNNFQLYSHQAQAINSVMDGKNTIMVTSTASGKSLGYNIPVFQSILTEPKSTFLYLFPQKALSQDQYSKIVDMFNFLEIPSKYVGIYDGDTTKEEKARIRRESRIIITNPYGLHYYIPYKNLWARIWKNLKYIIIDECHFYRGIFGSNFSQVIRRLKRILRSFNVEPQFILSSATIKNPGSLAQKLTGEKDFEIIDRDGAPNSGRYFVFWDLPMYFNSDIYKSPHAQTRNLFNYIVEKNLQTLAFTRSRKMAELNAMYSRNFFKENNEELLSEQIISYRAGLNPKDRRRIEKGLRNKDLIGVYATNALELGVDIGSLECTILSGFPGTISSMWQQVGRAGRKYDPNAGIEALSILIPLSDPLDLYYVHHPEELLSKPHEMANINLSNKYILKNHVKCAAKEAPLSEKDKKIFGDELDEAVIELEQEGSLKKRGTRYYYNSSEKFPPSSVNLSSISERIFKIIIHVDKGKPILTYEEEAYVFKELHPGAIYLYMAVPYEVYNLDIESREVHLKPSDGTTYTNVKVHTDIRQIGKPDTSKTERSINIYYGDVQVTETITGYDILSVEQNVKIGYQDLKLPPVQLNTKAVWFSIQPKYIDIIEDPDDKDRNFDGTIHAIEHAAIAMAPYFTMCDRWDIGGVSTRESEETLSGWPAIYIYDGFTGGIGISEILYDVLIQLLEKTQKLIEDCKCKEQCPGCVMSPKCGNNNEPLDKEGAIALLKELLSQ
jgi:DEAD/DEAH box helicase domain-containing protein